MKTAITLVNMGTTQLEHVLHEVVVLHVNNPNLCRGIMIDISDVKEIITAEQKHIGADDLLTLRWAQLCTDSRIQTQYVAIEDMGGDDVEVILRQDTKGNKLVVTIDTSKDADDYDDAIVHLYYEGDEEHLLKELDTFGVTLDDFESVVGDLLINPTADTPLEESEFFEYKASTHPSLVGVTPEMVSKPNLINERLLSSNTLPVLKNSL